MTPTFLLRDNCNKCRCNICDGECRMQRLNVLRKAKIAEKFSDHVMMFSGSSLCHSPMNTDEKPVRFSVSYAVQRKT